MKSKAVNKKLAINKKTVANLNNNDLNQVNGGRSNQICVELSDESYCLTACTCPYSATECPLYCD